MGGRKVPAPLPLPVLKATVYERRGRKRGKHRLDLLHIPGRLFSNGSSWCASLFTQQGRKGTNQDTMIFWENFGSRDGTIFCGVFWLLLVSHRNNPVIVRDIVIALEHVANQPYVPEIDGEVVGTPSRSSPSPQAYGRDGVYVRSDAKT